MKKVSRNDLRKKRHLRIRGKVKGNQERPRLNVFCSLRYIYTEVINDEENKVIAEASSKGLIKEKKPAGTVEAAREVGRKIAEKCITKGIKEIVFDRGGYKYHGKIKALAEAIREGGIKF